MLLALHCCKLQTTKYFVYLCDNNGNDLTTLQSALDANSFCELIVQYIPVNKISAKTGQFLRHQRLVHPCNECLYSAHKFIDGVPKFNQRSDVLLKYLTCDKVNMTKTTPGPNSTKQAIQHKQGIPENFSFYSVKSNNTGQRKDFVGNGKTCCVLVTNNHTGM